MATISSLPLELLQLIAAYCPATDILALGQTCRAFCQACSDPAVFQQSFENYLPEPDCVAFKDKDALVHFMQPYIDGPMRPCNHHEDTRMTWLFLAVAAARLPLVTRELERLASSVKVHATLESHHLGKDTQESLKGIIGLLSTLPVWGYSSVCNERIASTLDSLCPIFFSKAQHMRHLRADRALGDQHALQLAFCLAMSGLHANSWQPSANCHVELGDAQAPFGPGTDSLLAIVRSVFEGARYNMDYHPFQSSWAGKQTHALLLTVLITRNLHYVVKSGREGVLAWILGMGPATRTRGARIRVPDPARIEFLGSWYFSDKKEKGTDADHVWMHEESLRPRFPLPAPRVITSRGDIYDKGRYFYPFAGDDWWSWYTTRVRDLVRHLDDGEWFGYYTYDLLLAGRVDKPMENIQFRRTGTDGEKYTVEATDCFDSVGTFSLRGEVDASPSACTVKLAKQYTNHGFIWDGLVTPLGICGKYYLPNARRPNVHGYFWLWKKEWMDEMKPWLKSAEPKLPAPTLISNDDLRWL
ncbi:hypothetical protein F4780DRAFT_755597 [Xylariomycetidae sp. FL0641]|nr:hypothetical protein F4780DRAFT_755597 [Xylariomycetidae sp. FL0641]